MAPQRSASATLPLFCSYLTKKGRVASAYVLRHARTANPFPTPPPARVRPSSPFALGRSGGSVRPLAAPPHSRWGLQYNKRSLRPYPNPHPRPPLASLAAPLPLPAGGFNYIGYTINDGNTQPRPHPPPARAVRPRPFALGRSGRSVRQLAAPRPARGGL